MRIPGFEPIMEIGDKFTPYVILANYWHAPWISNLGPNPTSAV